MRVGRRPRHGTFGIPCGIGKRLPRAAPPRPPPWLQAATALFAPDCGRSVPFRRPSQHLRRHDRVGLMPACPMTRGCAGWSPAVFGGFLDRFGALTHHDGIIILVVVVSIIRYSAGFGDRRAVRLNISRHPRSNQCCAAMRPRILYFPALSWVNPDWLLSWHTRSTFSLRRGGAT